MDEYRQTLMGRALADVLRDLEAASAITPEGSDRLFEIFDAVLREELAEAPSSRNQRQPKRRKKLTTSSAVTPPPSIATDVPPSNRVFTHENMTITGTVCSFNRFMDRWSLHVKVPPGGLVVDNIPMNLHPPTPQDTEMLIKLHKPPA